MASLTTVSITSRKIIRYTIYGLVFIITARILFNIATTIYRRFVPKPPPPPTLTFGKLTALPFPEKKIPENLNFTLETVDGNLPKFPTQASIYLMPKASPSIKALDDAKATAKNLGFNPEGRELVETVYLFPHTTSPATLNMNIVTNIFSVSYDLSSKPTTIEKVPPASDISISTAKNFLNRAKLFSEDLNGPTTTEYLKIQEGKFVKVSSQSEANLVKVNFYRKKYKAFEPPNAASVAASEFPAVGPVYGQANVWLMISGAKEAGDTVIAAEYHYFPIDLTKIGTYPLKNSSQAWEDLKTRNAYFADVGNNPDGRIVIRKVYLAYYDAGQYTEFYQPVVVFEGDNNFAAYVPAVAKDYYGE